MDCTLRIHTADGVTEKKAVSGTNLLEFLHSNSIDISSPCGGHGTCGKCRIRINGRIDPPQPKETAHLGESALKQGFRLACYVTIQSDIEIYPQEPKDTAVILTDGYKKRLALDPIVSKKCAVLPPPDLHDQRADLERVLAISGQNSHSLSLGRIRALPELLRAHAYKLTLLLHGGRLIGIEPGDTACRLFGMAVDIGTTTIAAYLYDLNTGAEAAVISCINPQQRFGTDVITRINHTMDKPVGLQQLNDLIVGCVNDAAAKLAAKAGISTDDICAAVFAGNTTMMHLLMNLPPKHLALAPFVPVTTGMQMLSPGDIGLGINPQAVACVMPCISAYIGADTVAAVIASGMLDNALPSLLIDIGTNAEIVIGDKNKLFSCSVAAGPAFEGARIRCGVGGIIGAIDSMQFSRGLSCTTIGNQSAIGICGSGIVDAVAGMLNAQIIDETGYMFAADELPTEIAKAYGQRLTELPDGRAFVIADKKTCRSDEDIVVSQKDIREIQNAKAAVAAGILIMLDQSGIKMDEIENVFLAGGFGNYLDTQSAADIGLLPQALKTKTKAIGNAAGAGAGMALLSRSTADDFDRLRGIMTYVELSSDNAFAEAYVDAMVFPQPRLT